ncbi:MAG: hypothetical protein HY070_09310 [Chloroflexi bacterium]|nr:hypothetical protein [Chloroflexota bacterium]
MSRSKRARAPEANNFVRTDVLARTARIFQILFVVALMALLLIFMWM